MAATNTKQSTSVKIKWMPSTGSLSQIYSKGLEYCFISGDNKQCCPFVLCKDFLQDALMAFHRDKYVEIYGFEYDPKQNEPLHLARTKLAITNSSDPKFRDKIPNVLDFLHQVEKKLRLMRTRTRRVTNPPPKYKTCGVVLLEGSSRWILSPPMISMYSLLIRIGFAHKKGTDFQKTLSDVEAGKIKQYQRCDIEQLYDGKEGIDKILRHGYAKIFFKDAKKNFPDISTSEMHNSMGICSFASGYSQSYVKHWHRDLTKKKKKKGTKK